MVNCCGDCCGYYTLKSLKQPYRCLAKCTIGGFITGILCFVIGIILLVYYGKGIKSSSDKKRIPAYIGLGTFLVGLVFVIVGICLIVCLFRLIRRQRASAKVYRGEAVRSATTSPAPTPVAQSTYSPVPAAPSAPDTIVPHDQKI